MLAGMLAGAAAATVITLGTGASASVQPVPMRPASAAHHHHVRQLPRWFRWGSTNDRVNGEPCIIVWAAGQNDAEICQAAPWPSVSS